MTKKAVTKEKNMTKKAVTKVAIYVKDGAVQSILSNKADLKVALFDADIMKIVDEYYITDGLSCAKMDKKWDKIQEECHHAL